MEQSLHFSKLNNLIQMSGDFLMDISIGYRFSSHKQAHIIAAFPI